MPYIRNVLTHEKEQLFKKSSTGHQHYEDPATMHEHSDRSDDAERKGSISPAIEARTFSNFNENGMGAESHQGDLTWGWPGLGTYPEPIRHSARAEASSNSKTASGREADLEPRVETATSKPIDNAAKSEPFGWPGIGVWPGAK